MELSKLILVVEKPGKAVQFNDKDASRCIEAMFNPNKLTVSRSAQWQNQQAAKRDNPELQYTGAEPATLAIDLFFDTYDTPSEEKDSVRQYTDRLRLLTLVDGSTARPCVQLVGTGAVQGCDQIETQYTLFMGSGTPVRAITAARSSNEQRGGPEGTEPSSSDVARSGSSSRARRSPRRCARMVTRANGIAGPRPLVRSRSSPPAARAQTGWGTAR
jgi:hypothetical protein